MLIAAIAAMAMTMAAPLPPQDARCETPAAMTERMMAAGYDAFDQDMEGEASWRGIMGRGCYETAAQLVQTYLSVNQAKLNGEQNRTLHFHLGQILAFGGQEARAAHFFRSALGGDGEWDAYVASQLAFVARDRAGFEQARKRHRDLAPTSQRNGFLDSQSACFDKPFTEALMCEAKAP